MRSTNWLRDAIILVVGICGVRADAQMVPWTHLQGPYTGSIQRLTIDRQGDIFAMTVSSAENVYRSVDGGRSWEQVHSILSYGFEPVLFVDSLNNIYHGDILSGLYESTDRGTSWFLTSLAGGASAATVFPGNRLCVGGSQTISISDDSGKTWTTSQVRGDFGDVSSLAKDDSGDIIAGFYREFGHFPAGGGVYISSDAGRSWIPLGMGSFSILSMAVEGSGRVFVLATSDGTSSSIYSARRDSTNWKQDVAGMPFGAEIGALQVDRLGETVAVTSAGVFVYGDSTSSWKNAAPAVSPDSITTAHYDPLGISYMGTAYDGIYVLNAPESTWVQCGIFSASITSLGVDGAGNLYAGTDGGIFEQEGNTGSWRNVSNGLGHGKVFQIHYSPVTRQLYAATSDGLYYLPDGGNYWISDTKEWAYDLVEIPNNFSYIGSTGGILKAHFGDDLWVTPQTMGLPLTKIYCLALDSSNNLYAGAAYNGVFESTDGGTFWTQSGISSPLIFYSVKSMEIDGEGKIFAGTDTAGAYCSSDSGIDWKSIPSITGKSVTCFLMSRSSEYFAGTSDSGVFVSTDRGMTWQPANVGLEDSSVSSLLFDQQGNVYAGTAGGLFESAGFTTEVYGDIGIPGSFSLFQNYPNPFNPTTMIRYQLSAVGHVTLNVYDVLGRRVATLVNEVKTPGTYEVEFSGAGLASGVYFYRLIADGRVVTKRMVLIK